jgi:Outer membrane protein beta-barrel domain
MRTGLLLIFLAILMGVPALAQNSDLGVLLGVAPLRSQSTISTAGISSSDDATVQIDYSIQFLETSVGAFYIELPLAAVFHESNRIGPNIVSSDRDIIFFTPGVRWKLWMHSRISLYAALGGGLASFGMSTSTVGPSITEFSTRTTKPALDFGGGIDFRLTRLLSIRCEGRDYVTAANAGGFSGRNHAALDVGVGFHF